ncbi:MAG: DinB family protein [Candidatus Thorarchaeota archaeon]
MNLEISQALNEYKNGFSRLKKILDSIPENFLKIKLKADIWSIQEYIIHLVDTEGIYFIRFRKTISENNEKAIGFKQENWANEMNYLNQDLRIGLNVFEMMRNSNYALLSNLPEKYWQNKTEHPRFGWLSLLELLKKNNEHVHNHTEKIEYISMELRQ